MFDTLILKTVDKGVLMSTNLKIMDFTLKCLIFLIIIVTAYEMEGFKA